MRPEKRPIYQSHHYLPFAHGLLNYEADCGKQKQAHVFAYKSVAALSSAMKYFTVDEEDEL